MAGDTVSNMTAAVKAIFKDFFGLTSSSGRKNAVARGAGFRAGRSFRPSSSAFSQGRILRYAGRGPEGFEPRPLFRRLPDRCRLTSRQPLPRGGLKIGSGLAIFESWRRRCRFSSISVVTVERSSRRFSVPPRPRGSIARVATARGSRSCSRSSLSPEHRREPSRLKTDLAAPVALRGAECAGNSPEPAASARRTALPATPV